MGVRKAMSGTITEMTPPRNYRKQQGSVLTERRLSASSEDASPEMSPSKCDPPLQSSNHRLPSLFLTATPNIFNFYETHSKTWGRFL